ncbi:hypothetical protein T492DRAFT_287092 [Pavlovales sp. CCMP2436]|nr:hypothetical protein T492DRAFT_287092 [Pavlovales sp. CCMP2436]
MTLERSRGNDDRTNEMRDTRVATEAKSLQKPLEKALGDCRSASQLSDMAHSVADAAVIALSALTSFLNGEAAHLLSSAAQFIAGERRRLTPAQLLRRLAELEIDITEGRARGDLDTIHSSAGHVARLGAKFLRAVLGRPCMHETAQEGLMPLVDAAQEAANARARNEHVHGEPRYSHPMSAAGNAIMFCDLNGLHDTTAGGCALKVNDWALRHLAAPQGERSVQQYLSAYYMIRDVVRRAGTTGLSWHNIAGRYANGLNDTTLRQASRTRQAQRRRHRHVHRGFGQRHRGTTGVGRAPLTLTLVARRHATRRTSLSHDGRPQRRRRPRRLARRRRRTRRRAQRSGRPRQSR